MACFALLQICFRWPLGVWHVANKCCSSSSTFLLSIFAMQVSILSSAVNNTLDRFTATWSGLSADSRRRCNSSGDTPGACCGGFCWGSGAGCLAGSRGATAGAWCLGVPGGDGDAGSGSSSSTNGGTGEPWRSGRAGDWGGDITTSSACLSTRCLIPALSALSSRSVNSLLAVSTPVIIET